MIVATLVATSETPGRLHKERVSIDDDTVLHCMGEFSSHPSCGLAWTDRWCEGRRWTSAKLSA